MSHDVRMTSMKESCKNKFKRREKDRILKLDQKSNPANTFQELQGIEKHAERLLGVAFNKIQTVRNSTGGIR